MDVKRVEVQPTPVGNRRRGRGGGYGKKKNGAVCIYWLQGRCNRNPCRFVHDAEVNINQKPTNYTYHRNNPPNSNSKQKKQRSQDRGVLSISEGDGTQANHIDSIQNSHPESQASSSLNGGPGDGITQKTAPCVYGDGRQYVHSCFLRLALLDGHNQAVTGIALPSGSDKLYTASGDGIVRVWDCHTGQCVDEGNLGAQIACLISQGPWMFAGLRNFVKAWNFQTETQYDLDGVVGQVYALETTTEDVLFAGMEDGSISKWKYNPQTNSFQLITTLKGHTGSVLSLKALGRKSLYSGSMDRTIRRWDLDALTCSQTLSGHSAAVTSLVPCWEDCFLSSSSDGTIKMWAGTKDGNMGVIHTHNEEHAILALYGMYDADDKPILCCSCDDNSVKLYELPSLTERGRIFGKQVVWRILSGPGGLFFTGDGTGQVAVWKWLTAHTA